MPQMWTITSLDSTKVLMTVFHTPSTGSHPKDNGWAWDATTQKAWKIDRIPDTTVEKWNGTAWVEDLQKAKDLAIDSIKTQAEQRKMAFLSNGGAKKAEYAQKAAEVAFFDSLGGSVNTILSAIGLMTASARQAKFGYSLADAAAFGDPNIVNAIERFRAGMTSSNKVPAIAAVEAKACDTIKKATTVAAVKAVTVTWP